MFDRYTDVLRDSISPIFSRYKRCISLSVHICHIFQVQEVYEFIRNLAGCSVYADEFRSQEIDGQALLLLKEDHLMSTMNMKLGPALKICARINAIKEETGWKRTFCTCSGDLVYNHCIESLNILKRTIAIPHSRSVPESLNQPYIGGNWLIMGHLYMC